MGHKLQKVFQLVGSDRSRGEDEMSPDSREPHVRRRYTPISER